MKDTKNIKTNSGISNVIETTGKQVIDLAASNSVLGDAINKDGITIIPVSKISAGFAGGGFEIKKSKKSESPAGAGAKVEVTPTHFIQIINGKASLIPAAIPNNKQDTLELLFKTVKNLIKKK